MTCRVVLRETTIVPPNSGTFVPINIPYAQHLTNTGMIETNRSHGDIYVVLGLVDLQCDALLINILNTSSEPVTLYANQQVGTCVSYSDMFDEKLDYIRASFSEVAESCNENNNTIPAYLQDLLHRSSIHLDNDQTKVLENLLIKYASVFSKSPDDIGRTNLAQHRINTGTAFPIRQPCRRLPLGKMQIEKDELQKMIDNGIIEPSSSPWSSNIVLVIKKDGKVRFCVDYRRLNDVTVKDAYPLPRVDSCLDSLAGAKWFSSMDLNSGFWQIAMSPEDKEKTAFNTSLGLYQFTVMPFGLAKSPSTFERLMENVLRGMQWQECLVYMDDIIAPSTTFTQGLERLEHIFQRLLSANLKLKPSKCTFFQKEIKFLGHIVSESGIATDPQKSSAIMDWPVLTSAKQAKSFLGSCSYYWRFVKGFAQIARPLHKICEKGSKFQWSQECQDSFDVLKQKLTESPILSYPLPGLGFVLDTDSSDKAVGAVLSQIQDGSEKVIAYMSRAMNKHEQQYCVTRKELLAVVVALKTFHSYLYGQEVLLRTDNAAISWMKNLKNPTGQTARWLQEIETYNLTVTHRVGTKHLNADALNRRLGRSCERQEQRNLLSDSDEDTNEVTPEISVRAVTRSEAAKDTISPESGIVLHGWQLESVRQAQLDDKDIALLLVAKESNENRTCLG